MCFPQIIKQQPSDVNMQSYVTDEITQIYDKLAREIEQLTLGRSIRDPDGIERGRGRG